MGTRTKPRRERLEAVTTEDSGARLAAGEALHGLRDPGDDPAGRRPRGHKHGPGIPGLPRALGPQGGGGARREGRLQPVRDNVGVVGTQGGDSGEGAALQRHPGHGRGQRHGDLRRDGGDGRDHARADRLDRRGDSPRALLRVLPPLRDNLGSEGAPRPARGARLRVRRGGAEARVLRPGRHQAEGDHNQHAQQPHREGLLEERARAAGRPLRRPRSPRDNRRDLRADSVRRGEAREPGDPRGHGGHDRDHLREPRRPTA